MPQEFESPAPQSALTAEEFAARQKVTPEEITAALDALHEQQQAPIGFDMDLSIGQVLDELDLPLPAGDLWREVQAQRARKAQTPASIPVLETAPVSRPRTRRWVVGTVAAALALLVPLARYARVSDTPHSGPADPPAVSRSLSPPAAGSDTTNSTSRDRVDRTDTTRNDRADSQNSTNTATDAPSVSLTPPSIPQNTLNISPQTSGNNTVPAPQGAQKGTNVETQTTRPDTQRAVRQTTGGPTIINEDKQVRTVNVRGGQLIVNGNGDTLTIQGRLEQLIVNGSSGTLRLRGPVAEIVLGGNRNKVIYSRAYPAPQIIDNGFGNSTRAQ